MTHPFQRYFDKHGRYPTIRLDSGIQQIEVIFHPGYVHLHASPPYQADLYLTRPAWIKLLKSAALLPLTRKMSGEFDVVAAMREAYFFEMQILQEKRARKKVERLAAKEATQKLRYLAAKARAQRRDAGLD